MRKLFIVVTAFALSIALMGAGSASPAGQAGPHPEAGGAGITLPPTPDPSSSLNPILNVVGVLTGDAQTPTPTPIESIAGETATPTSGTTPPPTAGLGSEVPPGPGPGWLAVILSFLLLACVWILIAQRGRRSALAEPSRSGRPG